VSARKWAWGALVLSSVAGCDQLIGADFSDLKPREATGGAAGQGGSGEGGSAGDVAQGGSGGTATDTGGSSGTGGDVADARDVMNDRSNDGRIDAGPDAQMETAPPDDGSVDLSDALVGELVINEMEGIGDDWIELYNAGMDTIALDGFGIAQASGTSGPPDLGSAVVFPAGTSMSPGSYVLIVGKQLMVGPTTSCFGLAPSCFGVTWGISSSNGEGMYIMRPNSTPLALVVYPPPTNEGGAPVSGQTWGRIPNGTGDFTITAATPNAANHQ